MGMMVGRFGLMHALYKHAAWGECRMASYTGDSDRPLSRGLQILAYVNKVRDVSSNVDHSTFTMEDVESNIVRCPDQEAAKAMIDGECSGPKVFIQIIDRHLPFPSIQAKVLIRALHLSDLCCRCALQPLTRSGCAATHAVVRSPA